MGLKHEIGKKILSFLPISRRTFDILRFEMNSLKNACINAASPRYHKRIKEIRNQKGISVNLGSGGRGLDGWVNVDALRSHRDISFTCDIRHKLPFRDGQVRRLFAEHVIEHIDFRSDLPRVLKEFYRVLELGGRVRVIVPDGRRWLEAYVSNDPEKWAALGFPELPSDMPTPMAMINHVFHQGGEHKFAYDFETLHWALSRAGFQLIEKRGFRDSGDPDLAIDRSEHADYSLYVEGVR